MLEETNKNEIETCKRHLWKKLIKKTKKSELAQRQHKRGRKDGGVLFGSGACIICQKRRINTKNRPIKETCEWDQQFVCIHLIFGPRRSQRYAKISHEDGKRGTNETSEHGKRSTKETCSLNTSKETCEHGKRPTKETCSWNVSKDTYEHGKRPTKETCLLKGWEKSRGLQKCAKRDVWINAQFQGKRHINCLSYISTSSRGTKETHWHGKRHRKETYVLFIVHQHHITGYKRDL